MRWVLAVVAIGTVAASAGCSGHDDGTTHDASESEDAVSFRGKRVTYDKTMPDVDAIGYDVSLAVTTQPIGHESFAAEVAGTFVATRSLTSLELDLEGNEVDAVQVSGKATTFTRKGSVLSIALPRTIATGRAFTATVKYHGTLYQADGANPNDFDKFGGLMAVHQNRAGKTIYSSLNWPSKARRWLPLRDHPRDGAMVAMKVTFPSALTVVANGDSLGSKKNGDGTTTSEFEALTPMPTYDYFVAAYDGWSEKSATSRAANVAVHSYAYTADRAIADQIVADVPAAVDYYGGTFGAFKWGSSISFLEVPIFGGGMEHATVVSLDETLFSDAAGSRTIAFHELAHHWSGNSSRIGTWNDFWMSEGFTDYLTRRFVEAHDGKEAGAKLWKATQSRALADSGHALRPADPERDVLEIFDDVSYQKGAFVLRMLEHRLGTGAFTTFLRGWFDHHRFAPVTTSDFAKELVAAAPGLDVDAFFAQWVYAAGHPELKVTWKRADAANVDVTVEQVQRGGPAKGFITPVEIDLVRGAERTRATIDLTGKTTTARMRAASDPTSIAVDPDTFLLAQTL